jgi:hypothetical protein
MEQRNTPTFYVVFLSTRTLVIYKEKLFVLWNSAAAVGSLESKSLLHHISRLLFKTLGLDISQEFSFEMLHILLSRKKAHK